MRGRFKERIRILWRHRLPPNSVYAFAFGCVVAACITRFALGLADPAVIVFGTFYSAVLIATLIGGAWAGTLVLVLGGIFGLWSFMPPYFCFAPCNQIARPWTDEALKSHGPKAAGLR
jgi:hypothetical protein